MNEAVPNKENANTNVASPVTHDRVRAFAGYLLDAYGNYDAAHDECARLYHEALSYGGVAGRLVADMWELVSIELSDQEVKVIQATLDEGY